MYRSGKCKLKSYVPIFFQKHLQNNGDSEILECNLCLNVHIYIRTCWTFTFPCQGSHATPTPWWWSTTWSPWTGRPPSPTSGALRYEKQSGGGGGEGRQKRSSQGPGSQIQSGCRKSFSGEYMGLSGCLHSFTVFQWPLLFYALFNVFARPKQKASRFKMFKLLKI